MVYSLVGIKESIPSHPSAALLFPWNGVAQHSASRDVGFDSQHQNM